MNAKPMSTSGFSLAQPTTPNLTFAEDLALCAQLGIRGLGIDWAAKVGDLATALADFRESGLLATFALPAPNAVLPFIGPGALPGVSGPTDPELRVARMCASIRQLAAFEPSACVCISGPMGDRSPDEAYELAVAGLKQAARTAAEVGIVLAVEPIHATLKDEFSFVNTISDAMAMLGDIDEPNTGLLIDLWHVADTPALAETLQACAPRVTGVHINNRREPTRSWCDRTLPADGTADFDAFVGALLDGGYTGWFELEVISDDGRFGNDFDDSLWKLAPGELVGRGQAQLAGAVDRANNARAGGPRGLS
jgi:sugar phosphate isomerase/epimerase